MSHTHYMPRHSVATHTRFFASGRKAALNHLSIYVAAIAIEPTQHLVVTATMLVVAASLAYAADRRPFRATVRASSFTLFGVSLAILALTATANALVEAEAWSAALFVIVWLCLVRGWRLLACRYVGTHRTKQ